MVGVLSMCPPHHFSQIPTSGHPCRPARTRFFAYLALHGLHTTLCTLPHTSAHLCTPPHTSVHLHTPLHTSVHLCTPFRMPLCTSAHLHAPLCNFCTSLSRASHPYQTFHFDLRPLQLPGATQP